MKPETRKEQYLAAIAGDKVGYPAKPITREEAYLDRIAKNGSGGGGGEITVEKNNIGSVTSVGELPRWSIAGGIATFHAGVLPAAGSVSVVTDVIAGG